MACRFCDNIQKSYPNKRLRVLLFFRYPISVCRFSLGYWQSSLFTHQPPVVPQSQPSAWQTVLKVISVGETLQVSLRGQHSSKQSTAYFEHTVIFFLLHRNLQVTGCWNLREQRCSCCYRLFITSYFHWFFRHICMNIIKTNTEMQKGFTLCI